MPRKQFFSAIVMLFFGGASLTQTVSAHPPESIEERLVVSAKYSEGKWFDSGFDVPKNARISITANGFWRLGKGNHLRTDADGLIRLAPNGDFYFGTLLGRIGERGRPFKIGTRYQHVHKRAGRLYLINNDTVASDNSGELEVLVRCNECGEHGRHQNQGTKFSVSARNISGTNEWFDTGIDIKPRATISIEADGQWRLGEESLLTDANGLGHTGNYRGHRYGALIGKIGVNGETFAIGRSLRQSFNKRGRLYLANNDSAADDNSGSLDVWVHCPDCGSHRDDAHADAEFDSIQHSFTIPAKNTVGVDGWFNTGLTVRKGAQLHISANGKWRLGPDLVSDADGIKGKHSYGGYRFGTLLGRIGADGKVFPVGKTYLGVAGKTGTLQLAMNDSNNFDNSGKLKIAVSCEQCRQSEGDSWVASPTEEVYDADADDDGDDDDRPKWKKKSLQAPANRIASASGWLDTGVNITRKTRLKIRTTGKWKISSYSRALNADGLDSKARHRGFRYGALIGKIGKNGLPFLIGTRYENRPREKGRLYLANNDDFAADNSGALKVEIECRRCGLEDADDERADHYSSAAGKTWQLLDSSGKVLANELVLLENGQIRSRHDIRNYAWRERSNKLYILDADGNRVITFTARGGQTGWSIYDGVGANGYYRYLLRRR